MLEFIILEDGWQEEFNRCWYETKTEMLSAEMTARRRRTRERQKREAAQKAAKEQQKAEQEAAKTMTATEKREAWQALE